MHIAGMCETYHVIPTWQVLPNNEPIFVCKFLFPSFGAYLECLLPLWFRTYSTILQKCICTCNFIHPYHPHRLPFLPRLPFLSSTGASQLRARALQGKQFKKEEQTSKFFTYSYELTSDPSTALQFAYFQKGHVLHYQNRWTSHHHRHLHHSHQTTQLNKHPHSLVHGFHPHEDGGYHFRSPTCTSCITISTDKYLNPCTYIPYSYGSREGHFLRNCLCNLRACILLCNLRRTCNSRALTLRGVATQAFGHSIIARR